MSFIQMFRPGKYILDSSLIHSCQTALSNYISHGICIKQNCLFATSYNTLKNLWSLGKTYYRWQNQSLFLKNQLHGNISLRFGLEIMEGFSEILRHATFISKMFHQMFDRAFRRCHAKLPFLVLFIKRKFISMNRFIVPNLANLWRLR